MKKSLQIYEWIFFVTIATLMAIVFAISKITSYRSLDLLDQQRKITNVLLEVEVGGHVKKPGSYQVVKGDPLSEVLFKARPKPLADLSMLDLNESIEESRSIQIKPLEKVRIRVEGCVKEAVFLEMPAGSRICDLMGLVELSSDADKRYMRRRRILKNCEVLVVPTRCK